MALIEDCDVVEKTEGWSSFKAAIDQAAIDSKLGNWDSSTLYQVKNFVSYSLKDKIHMFESLHADLSRSNQLNRTLNNKITVLDNKLKQSENNLYISNVKLRDATMTNNLIYKERDSAVLTAKNCESIIQNWTHSHHKLNKIIDVQIPEQCEKILGGKLDDAVEIF